MPHRCKFHYLFLNSASVFHCSGMWDLFIFQLFFWYFVSPFCVYFRNEIQVFEVSNKTVKRDVIQVLCLYFLCLPTVYILTY
jgi:hypothetical protein